MVLTDDQARLYGPDALAVLARNRTISYGSQMVIRCEVARRWQELVERIEANA